MERRTKQEGKAGCIVNQPTFSFCSFTAPQQNLQELLPLSPTTPLFIIKIINSRGVSSNVQNYLHFFFEYSYILGKCNENLRNKKKNQLRCESGNIV